MQKRFMQRILDGDCKPGPYVDRICRRLPNGNIESYASKKLGWSLDDKGDELIGG